MIKGLGIAAFSVFIGVCVLMLRIPPGFGFWTVCLVAVLVGCLSVMLLTLPLGFGETLRSAGSTGTLSADRLAKGIEEVASVIRQDGLLALESKRKEIRDPNLSYVLKRVMAGFESKDLIPWVRNRQCVHVEKLQIASEAADRFTALIPSIGLFASLVLISGILSETDRIQHGIGIAHVFAPFLLALGIQVILDSLLGNLWSQAKLELDRYFTTLEEGVVGIQSGLNPELLADRMQARIHSERVWSEK